MLTSEGGSAAIFPNINDADRKAAIRLPLNNHLSSPISDFLAMIFLPALRICIGTASGTPPHYAAFWTLAAAVSIVLIYVQGGYNWAVKPNCLKRAGLAIGDFLATSFAMLAASYLSIDHATAPNPWTVGEVCPCTCVPCGYTIPPFNRDVIVSTSFGLPWPHDHLSRLMCPRI